MHYAYLFSEVGRLFMQGLYHALVVLQVVCYILVLLQERLHAGLVTAHVITRHQTQRVVHPCVDVVSICEELKHTRSYVTIIQLIADFTNT